MKIFSPIGNVPFTPDSLRIKDGSLVLEGSMGAWPTTIQFELSDIPAIIKVIRYPIIAIAALIVLVTIIGRLR